MNDADWYALIEGEEYGPLSRAQILAFLRDGTLAGNDLVWRPRFESWLPLRELQEFWRPPTRGQSHTYALVRQPTTNHDTAAPPPLPEINRGVTAPPPLPELGDRKRQSSSSIWLVFQSVIIFAFVASNIAYEWTPNKLIPVLFGVGVAFLLTALWNKLRSGSGSK